MRLRFCPWCLKVPQIHQYNFSKTGKICFKRMCLQLCLLGLKGQLYVIYCHLMVRKGYGNDPKPGFRVSHLIFGVSENSRKTIELPFYSWATSLCNWTLAFSKRKCKSFIFHKFVLLKTLMYFQFHLMPTGTLAFIFPPTVQRVTYPVNSLPPSQFIPKGAVNRLMVPVMDYSLQISPKYLSSYPSCNLFPSSGCLPGGRRHWSKRFRLAPRWPPTFSL